MEGSTGSVAEGVAAHILGLETYARTRHDAALRMLDEIDRNRLFTDEGVVSG